MQPTFQRQSAVLLLLFLALFGGDRASASGSEALSSLARNKATMRTLDWEFGRGWYLYSCLVVDTVGLEVPMDGECLQDPDFGGALRDWQRKNRLSPTGIMDYPTISKMKLFWQNRRVLQRGLGAEESFVTVPVSDTTQRDARELGRRSFQAFQDMRTAARADGIPSHQLTLISGYRSPSRQAALRRQNPGANTNQIAKKSAHSTGRAIDFHVGGTLVSTGDSNRATQINSAGYRWLCRNASRYGFVPYFYEPWHWEYIGN